jgi:regulation of enolase protein 1 (concanavalin A-like superfamily)
MLTGELAAFCALVGAGWFQDPVQDFLGKIAPGPTEWIHSPASAEVRDGVLTIAAGPATNWFVSPADGEATHNAPILLLQADHEFILTARVGADLASKWDAGMLMVYLSDSQWAKLAFEKSAYLEPTIVTVVTRGASDDCNSSTVAGKSVWLRVAGIGQAVAFYSSHDGKQWRLVRTFTFGASAQRLRVGFGAQSPVGPGAAASFSNISYTAARVKDVFRGE